MSTLALDQNCDLKIENDSFVILTGADEVAQKVFVRFQFYLGEWFLDTRLGFPGYEKVHVKNPDLHQIRALMRELVDETPGVDVIETLELDFESASRTLKVDLAFRVLGEDQVFDYTKEFILQ